MKNWFRKFPQALVQSGKKHRVLKYPILLILFFMVAVCEVCDAVKTLTYPKMRRRMLAAVLSVCMVFTLLPMQAFAVEPAQGGLCEHHLAHTAECGYSEGTAGMPCTHEHTEDCYQESTDCIHVHTAECYDADAEVATDSDTKEPVNCTHICDEESCCITKAPDCPHDRDEHDDTCGYVAGTAGTPCGYVCEICNQTSELPDQDEIPAPEQGECTCPPVDSGELVHGEDCPLYVAPPVPEQICNCTAICTAENTNPDCPVCSGDWVSCAYTAPTVTEAVLAVYTLIETLPTLDELDAVDTEAPEFADYLAQLRADVTAARAAYDALTDEEKAAFDTDALAKLAALEEVLAAMPALMAAEGTAIIDQAGLKAITGSGSYYLANDIALSGAWTPISGFTGTLDGDGHKITGLNVDTTTGLGGLIANLYNGGVIKNLHVEGNVHGSYEGAGRYGGIVSSNSGSIIGCTFSGKVWNTSGDNHAIGGICGLNEGTISGCTNNGTISGKSDGGGYDAIYVGGIAGSNHGTITDCTNTGVLTGEVPGTATYYGDLFGSDTWQSYGGYVGGIAGDTKVNKITNCTNSGTVIADNGKPVEITTVPSAVPPVALDSGSPAPSKEELKDQLPDKVQIETSGGNRLVDVAWDVDASNYDPTTAGDYTIDGTLTLPEGGKITNNEGADLTTSVVVTVTTTADPVPTDAITIEVSYGKNTKTANGTTLKDAVTKALNGAEATTITALKITAGTVTTEDWNELSAAVGGTYNYIFKTFEIADDQAVTVAGIPDFDISTDLFPHSITGVTIPQAITVGKQAFRGCAKLTTVSLPKATVLGTNAFRDCNELINVKFPEVTELGLGAFEDCTKLTTAELPKVTDIVSSAFYGCQSLETVDFPAATSIGMNAFEICYKLHTANFPQVTQIGTQAFQDCIELTTLKLGATVPQDGNGLGDVFVNCPADRSLVLVDAAGNPLTESTDPKLSAVAAAYDAVKESGGTATDGLWLGWKVREPVAAGHVCNGITFDKSVPTSGNTFPAGNYFLDGDVTASVNLVVAKGTTVNLCLNGHKLTASNPNESGGKYSSITVQWNGTLNIYDCSVGNTGKITGGSARQGGCIYNEGTLNLHGGTITGNTAANFGGGVFSEGKVTLYGNASITGNTKDGTSSNLYHDVYRTIEVGSKLTSTIGISPFSLPDANSSTTIAKAAAGYTLTEDDAKCFVSDVPGYEITYDSASKSVQMAKIVPQASWAATGGATGAGTLTAALAAVKSTGGTVTLLTDVRDNTNVLYVDITNLTKPVTLVLNGKTLYGTMGFMNNTGLFTIDGTAVGSKIQGVGGMAIMSDSHLNLKLKGGTYIGAKDETNEPPEDAPAIMVQVAANNPIELAKLKTLLASGYKFEDESEFKLGSGEATYALTGNIVKVVKDVPVAVTSVSLSKTTLSLEAGKSETLTATIAPTTATNKAVTWKTSNPIATVDTNGKVTALKEGSATITVITTDGGKTATCAVTVTAAVIKPAPGGTLDSLTTENVDKVFGEGNATLDGDRITINNNITVEKPIIIKPTPITIDLGGNTITGGANAKPVIVIDNSGTGTITGGGSITGGNGGAGVGVGDGSTVTVGDGTVINGGDNSHGAGGNGITGGAGSDITISGGTTVNGGDGQTGGNGITSGGNVTVDGSVTGGNGSDGKGGAGVDTSGGSGDITINPDGSASGGNSTGDNGNGGNGTTSGGNTTVNGDATGGSGSGSGSGGSGATNTAGGSGTITVQPGGSAQGGNGGTSGGSGGDGIQNNGSGSTTVGGDAAGGNGGAGSSTGGAGGNGTTTGSGSTDIGAGGSASGGNGGTGSTGGNGGNGSTSTDSGSITNGGSATGGNGGSGATGGNGGNGTSTDGSTTVDSGGSSTGGTGGTGSTTGGNGGNGTSSGSTTVNGGATGGSGGSGTPGSNGNGGNGGNGANQGSGTVNGNGTATGGNGGNGSGTGDGGTGGSGVGGGASAGGSITNKPGASGLKVTTEVNDSQAGTTVTVPDQSKLTDAALTEAEKNDPDITEVKVVLNVKKEQSSTDKDKVEGVLSSVPADTIGAFFDITLDKIITKTNGGVQPSEKVENASTEIEITITIPSDMRGGSDYVVIRVHNGTGEALATTRSGDDLTFKTDKFSTYAIAYTLGGTTPPTPPAPNPGGDSDNSSGGSSGSIVITPPTTDKPNNPTQAEITVDGKVESNGNATISITDKVISDAINKAQETAKKNGNEANGVELIINVNTGGSTAGSIIVNLPKSVQEKVIKEKVTSTTIAVNQPSIRIGINLVAMTEMNRQANADIQLSATRTDATKLSAEAKKAIGNRPAFDLKATYANGSKSVTNFGAGSVSVAIPYTLQNGEVAGGLYAVLVDGNGKVSYITNSSYDAENKVLRFSTNHFLVYGISYKAPTAFTDIASHWAKTDIEFVVNRGLMSGTGNTTFAPNDSMTRGMYVTALGRLAGVDANSYKTGKFTDVKADAYYAPYVNWAAEKGITNGTTATTFSPDTTVTRQEMAVIMQNYAKALGYTVPETREAVTFADNGSIGSWASEAVKSMQMAGVIMGKDGNRFDPAGTASRAEVSAVLHRYVELVIDRTTAQGLDVNDSGKIVYYENGRLFTGTKTIDGTTYHFGNDGICIKIDAIVPDTKKYIIHKVVRGDTLWDIAIKNKCTVAEIVGLNGIKDPNLLLVGAELKIPQK